MTHTPGPWEVASPATAYDGYGVYSRHEENTVRSVAHVAWRWEHAGHADFAQTLANASLLAAAPDLLLTLRNLLDTVERGDEHRVTERCDDARKAIAKAESDLSTQRISQ